MTILSAREKGRREIQHRRHSSMDAGIQPQGGGSNTVLGTGLRHPCRNDGHHKSRFAFQPTALCAAHVHHAASLVCSEPALLSDEQLDYYAEVFTRLNEQYSLTRHHHFNFEDFLDSPEHFEKVIHVYFANKAVFENRLNGAAIHLHIFLRYPVVLPAALDADHAVRESRAVKAERLLPKQLAAVQKINLAEIAWFQEQVVLLFERHHRVLMRGGAYVQPNTHYYRYERKKAGG